MGKLKNTPGNKLMVMTASAIALAFIGNKLGKKTGDSEIFMVAGGVLGFFISPGVFSFVLDPKDVKFKK